MADLNLLSFRNLGSPSPGTSRCGAAGHKLLPVSRAEQVPLPSCDQVISHSPLPYYNGSGMGLDSCISGTTKPWPQHP